MPEKILRRVMNTVFRRNHFHKPEDRVLALADKNLSPEIIDGASRVIAAHISADGSQGSAKIGRFGSTVVAVIGLGGLIWSKQAADDREKQIEPQNKKLVEIVNQKEKRIEELERELLHQRRVIELTEQKINELHNSSWFSFRRS